MPPRKKRKTRHREPAPSHWVLPPQQPTTAQDGQEVSRICVDFQEKQRRQTTTTSTTTTASDVNAAGSGASESQDDENVSVINNVCDNVQGNLTPVATIAANKKAEIAAKKKAAQEKRRATIEKKRQLQQQQQQQQQQTTQNDSPELQQQQKEQQQQTTQNAEKSNVSSPVSPATHSEDDRALG